MIFKLFKPKKPTLQKDYINIITPLLSSPLFDGTEDQIRHILPKDLNEETLTYIQKQLSQE